MRTRGKMDELTKLMETKFDNFKSDLLKSINLLIQSEIKAYFQNNQADHIIGDEHTQSVKIVKDHVATLLVKQTVLEKTILN